MERKNRSWTWAAFGLTLVLILPPLTAEAQSHRQKTKNDWRNAAIAAGAVGLYGLAKGDSTLALLGIGGAVYSEQRYEHDRKSQNAMERHRAAIFKRGYFYSHGHKYVKHKYRKNGHTYYKFVRAK